ncbi:hypothetical protein MRX96_050296 [Rhipicephalus microplus]
MPAEIGNNIKENIVAVSSIDAEAQPVHGYTAVSVNFHFSGFSGDPSPLVGARGSMRELPGPHLRAAAAQGEPPVAAAGSHRSPRKLEHWACGAACRGCS